MSESCTVGIVSDIHYAGAAEHERGNDYEFRTLTNPLRFLVRLHRRFLWLHQPLDQNHLLDHFLNYGSNFDYVVANGDYSCNTGFIGLSDEAARLSARECIDKLRQRFHERLRLTIGDHELGKTSFVGGRGGMRLASWRYAREDLKLPGFWKLEIGRYVLLGVVSSLVALPVYEPDTLPEERSEWSKLRAAHMTEVREAFQELKPDRKVLLFCHDPTALPFLLREEVIRSKIDQIEQTIIGHLHSNFILRQSRMLSGMPRITFMGHTATRLSTALREARHWRPFKVRLCPSLAGIELLKDGGYLTTRLDPSGSKPAEFQLHRVPRQKAA
jgi:hypothetical protein